MILSDVILYLELHFKNVFFVHSVSMYRLTSQSQDDFNSLRSNQSNSIVSSQFPCVRLLQELLITNLPEWSRHLWIILTRELSLIFKCDMNFYTSVRTLTEMIITATLYMRDKKPFYYV